MLGLTLSEILVMSDSGTWGDEGTDLSGNPVLRSSNIQNYKLDIDHVAWRIVPARDIDKKRLLPGDIIVTSSSGSPELIAKCALFDQPDDGRDYYFSNFTLRLRADQTRVIPKYLYYWL